MWWLWEVLTEFVNSVAGGDRSWRPFLLGVALITATVIALRVWG